MGLLRPTPGLPGAGLDCSRYARRQVECKDKGPVTTIRGVTSSTRSIAPRFPLPLRNVEDLLSERGIDICHETVRFWWNRFGPLFAGDIRRQRVSRMRAFRHWRWHLDEMYVNIGGEMRYRTCKDGTTSTSQHRSGICSRHAALPTGQVIVGAGPDEI